MERSKSEWLPAVLARFFPGEVEVHLEGDMAGVSCDLDGEKSVMSPLLRVRQWTARFVAHSSPSDESEDSPVKGTDLIWDAL